MYVVFPVLTSYGIYPSAYYVQYSLSGDHGLVWALVLTSASCNLAFGLGYMCFSRKGPHQAHSPPRLPVDPAPLLSRSISVGFLTLFLGLIIIGWFFPYARARPEAIHSIMSTGKVVLCSLYIVRLTMIGFDRSTKAMFALQALLMVIEGSRWYFLSAVVATVLHMEATTPGGIPRKKVFMFGAALGISLSVIGLLRVGSRVSLDRIASPFFIEGNYGSYMVLQSFDLLRSHSIHWITCFSDYVVDPLIYLVPRPIYWLMGINKDEIGIYQFWVSAHRHLLTENYAPVGGFNYMAQATNALPFVGPPIMAFALATVTLLVEARRFISSLHWLHYYIFSAGFMFVFIKTLFHQTCKYYVTLVIPALILYWIISRHRARFTEITKNPIFKL